MSTLAPVMRIAQLTTNEAQEMHGDTACISGSARMVRRELLTVSTTIITDRCILYACRAMKDGYRSREMRNADSAMRVCTNDVALRTCWRRARQQDAISASLG